MVLVDTSIWISLYRKPDSKMGQVLWSLVFKNEVAICGQIWVEFLGGFQQISQRSLFEDHLESFPFLSTSKKAYQMAGAFLADFPALGSGDVIIASTAITSGCPLLTLDKSFQQLTKYGLTLLELPR